MGVYLMEKRFPGGDVARRDEMIAAFLLIQKCTPPEISEGITILVEPFLERLRPLEQCKWEKAIGIVTEVDELIRACSPAKQADLATAIISLRKQPTEHTFGADVVISTERLGWLLYHPLDVIMQNDLSFSFENWKRVFEYYALQLSEDDFLSTGPISVKAATKLMEFSDGVEEARKSIRSVVSSLKDSVLGRRHLPVIFSLSDIANMGVPLPLSGGEAWSDAAREFLYSTTVPSRKQWTQLISHGQCSSGSSPSKKWLDTARKIVEAIGEKEFVARMIEWFPLTVLPRTIRVLSDQEWEARCAAMVLRAIPSGTNAANAEGISYDDWYEIFKEVEKSERPWDSLVYFAVLPSVRRVYGVNPPRLEIPPSPPVYDANEDKLIIEPHMDILRGLAWACGLFPTPELARALTTLALSAYRKVPGKGPRAVRVGNACITGLAMMGGLDAVGQLAVLKVKVKFGTAQIAIEKALKACAEKSGIPRDELEEMSVPAYGLTEVGCLVEPLGECSAELRIVDSREVALIFRGADGKERKALPAAVKEQFREELKELSAAKKDIEKMLPAQAERLDALFLAQKTWALEAWLERYAEHPLVGALARRLIWNFSTGGITTAGVWFDGKFVDRSGVPVPLDVSQTRVSLWHPLGEPADIVLAWRVFLEERRIRQPFKQAHREIYLLTPAEAATVTYSNRFAAHLLRQHQFNSLCATRGWKNKLRLMVDDSYPPPTRRLPQWGLRAEFWIESAGDDFGTDTNESGVYLHVATDQVRFYPLEAAQVSAHASGGGYEPGWQETAAEPLRLVDVPAMVFSEIMRDVDLFVGVGSVGNDPAWADGGRREADRGEWGRFAFGDLSAMAKTRRDVLERLVPKLKIAALCSFEEKFLVVRGKLRTYKIHLGSGNILMSPNDQYLCIVPSRGKADSTGIFLPFEGDGVLSLIISKALLLAADDKITDPSITRQIRA